MKQILVFLSVLIWMVNTTVAQPAMINKGDSKSTKVDTTCQRETLEVEIIPTNGDPFQHPQHPENGLICPIRPWLTTNQEFPHYHWESSYSLFAGDPNDSHIRYFLDKPGFVKVEVWDDLGNYGSDSIWFQIKENKQIESFLMVIAEDMHPIFSGTVSDDQVAIDFYRENYPGGEDFGKTISLTPGQWSWKDEDAYYDEQNLWVYHEYLYDTCSNSMLHTLIPGILLNTREESGEWYLDMKTLLQGDNGYYHDMYGADFVYFIFTVDENGNRHHFMQGEPVKLGQYETEWAIPGPHVDPYYQCGVARILEDGTFELLSLSNKVDNPMHDTNGLFDETDTTISVYPNPTQGEITLEGKGINHVRIVNVYGQTVYNAKVEGDQVRIDLSQMGKGIYMMHIEANGGHAIKVVKQ